MAKQNIERSCDRERGITREFIRERIAWQKTPEGRKAMLEAEKRIAAAKAKLPPTRFPELAGRGTRPTLTGGDARTAHAKAILARVERNTPKL